MKKASKKPQDQTDNSSSTQESKSSGSKNENIKKQEKPATSKENPTKVKKSSKTTRSPKRPLAVSAVFLIALLATGLSAYDYWLFQEQKAQNTSISDNQSQLGARISQLEQRVEKTNNRLTADDKARAAAHLERQSINSSIQGISEKLGRNTVAWRMAEVEYLLTVANHRITLANDRKTAITVFETADSRLKSIADPSLLNVRKKISSELVALRSVPDVDHAGLAVQLGSLAESVEQLPLLDKKRLAVATQEKPRTSPTGWQEIPAAVWNDIKGLVKVRRHQQPTEPLLPPKQAWFLFQNLQLKLEQARLAVLQKNTALFEQSLGEASDWLTGYFDSESVAVISVQATIKELRSTELQPALPDVSASLRELRAVMQSRSLSAAKSPKVPATNSVPSETKKQVQTQ